MSAAGWGRWSPSGWPRPGAVVAGTDRTPETLERARRRARPTAERWDGRVVDLLDEDATRAWCAALVERFGRVDGLVHLVGGWRGGQPLHEAPLADWDLLHDLLIRTVQHTTRAFHDQLAASAARPLRPRLRQAGAGAVQRERRLRRGQGRRRGLDPRPRRRLRPAARATANIVVVDAILTPRMREESPGKEFPTFTPAEHIADGDRLPLLGRRRGDERPAPAAYHGR